MTKLPNDTVLRLAEEAGLGPSIRSSILEFAALIQAELETHGQDDVVRVCSVCDIADCIHVRDRDRK